MNNKGFTIIELIVVVAIIGVLSAIVASNVAQQGTAAKNAAVKQQLNSVLTVAAKHFDTNGSYDNLCANQEITNLRDGIKNAEGGGVTTGHGWTNCNDPATAGTCDTNDGFLVLAYLFNSSTLWCTDANGYSGAAPGGTADCYCHH